MVVPAATLTETQAIQQLMAAKGAAGTKVAAAAGLDPEAIREVLTAKAAAAKAGAAGAKGAMAGGVPVGVEPDLFRQAVATKAGGVKAAGGATGTKVGMLGVEPDIIRDAVLSKAVGGTGAAAATTAASGGATAVTTCGTIWNGGGWSLGLGLGLGVWGPVLAVAAGAAAVYGYLEYRKRHLADETEAEPESDEGFYAEKA